METTSNPKLVHVLPFVFRPYDRLEAELKELFIKPRTVEPRFLFKTMSSLAIDVTRQHQQDVQNALIDIRQDLDRSPFELELSNQITGRKLATGAFKLFFGITEYSQATLNTRLDRVASLLPNPSLVHEGPHKTMHLATTLLPSQVLETNEEIGAAGKLMKSRLTEAMGSYAYITISDGILGRDEISEVSSYISLQDKAS